MPDSAFGRLLEESVPQPPVTIDASEILSRARTRQRLRSGAVVTFVGAVVAGVVAVSSLAGGPSSSELPTTKRTTPHAVPTISNAPTPPTVLGLPVDQATIVLGRAQCMVTVRIVHYRDSRVGQVVSEQQVVSQYCEVALTVSAGPEPGSAAACTSLTVQAGRAGAGLGHAGFPVVFRNSGTTACTLGGYPDVTARELGSNRTVTARHTPQGYLGGTSTHLPTTYVLLPGDQVSVLVEGTDVPMGNKTTCPALGDFRVTAGTHTTAVGEGLSNCSGIEVHPYVPGTSGSLASGA